MSDLMPLHEIAKQLSTIADSIFPAPNAGDVEHLAVEVERHAGHQLLLKQDQALPSTPGSCTAATLAADALDMGLPGRFLRLLRVKIENYGAEQRDEGHAEALREARHDSS